MWPLFYSLQLYNNNNNNNNDNNNNNNNNNNNKNDNQLYFSRVALDSIKYCHLNLNEFYSIDSVYIIILMWKYSQPLQAQSTAFCLDCRCNLTGTVNASNVCDKVSGQCPCKPLLTGRTCNKCQVGNKCC